MNLTKPLNLSLVADACLGCRVALRLCAVGRKLHQLPIRKPTNNTPLATTGGLCGPIHDHVCNKQCCSRNFYCGNEEEHCALRLGCLEDWGVCGGSKCCLHACSL